MSRVQVPSLTPRVGRSGPECVEEADLDGGSGLCAALRSLLRQSHLAAPDDLPRLTQQAGDYLGASETVLYLVDYDQVLLLPLTDGTDVIRSPIAVQGTLAGRAFSEVETQIAADGSTVWTPLLDGTERLGTLEMCFPHPLGSADSWRPDATDLAALLAELVITRSLYGDLVERTRRRLPMSLAAELQWNLLPPLTFATAEVSVSGVLAPTYEVAGDSFDYAVNGDTIHLAILDAMGHGLEAAVLATVAVGSLRNARRAGLELADTVRSMDKHLAAHFRADTFVTGIVAELDMTTGSYAWISSGHPPALLIRQGQVVKALATEVNPPLGLNLGVRSMGVEQLEPGDRLLLYSDGVVEARDAHGTFFGTDRLVDLITRESGAGRPAPETLRRLNLAILDHQNGLLQDDATTLLVEWRGDPPGTAVTELP